MYDSRTHKPRIPGTHRYTTHLDRCTYYCCTDERRYMTDAQAIAEALDEIAEERREALEAERMAAMVDAAHREALDYHAMTPWLREATFKAEREALYYGWGRDVSDEWWEQRVEDIAYAQAEEEAANWRDWQDESEAEFIDRLGGEDDDARYYESDFLPLMTTAEAREHFGPDWEHNGFQITHQGRPYARTKKEKHMPEDIERAMAMQSVQAQRQRIAERTEALVAEHKADAKAKVERPEPTPYEKFAGASKSAPFYDGSLDPISPNFDRSAW